MDALYIATYFVMQAHDMYPHHTVQLQVVCFAFLHPAYIYTPHTTAMYGTRVQCIRLFGIQMACGHHAEQREHITTELKDRDIVVPAWLAVLLYE